MSKVDLRSAARAALFCATITASYACAEAEPGSGDGRKGATSDADAPAVLAQQTIQPDPNSTYFVEVVPNGSGCPLGTSNTRISADGLVFTTTFAAYEARVNTAVSTDVKDCQLAIRLHTPQGISFAVQSFSYSGYAFLQAGVRGTQTASYYYQGAPVQPSNSNRKELLGPFDNDFVFNDEIPVDERNWSTCDRERDLNIRTRMTLEGSSSRGGFMNLLAVDGSSLTVKLDARKCDENGQRTDEPVKPTDAPSPVQPPPTDPVTDPVTDPATNPTAQKVTIGQTSVLPIDDYANGGLLLAQKAYLRERATLENLSFYVSQASGKLRLGLYDSSGPSGRPGKKLAESGELTPRTGWNTASVSRIALNPGNYWLAYLPSSNDLHFQRGGDNSGTNVWYPYEFGPLPATFSSSPTVSTDHWSFYATFSK